MYLVQNVKVTTVVHSVYHPQVGATARRVFLGLCSSPTGRHLHLPRRFSLRSHSLSPIHVTPVESMSRGLPLLRSKVVHPVPPSEIHSWTDPVSRVCKPVSNNIYDDTSIQNLLYLEIESSESPFVYWVEVYLPGAGSSPPELPF